MRRRFEDNLIQSYPALFPPVNRPDTDEKIPIFACGEGWFMLIELMCEQIQDVVDDKNLPQPTISILQEKFGVMRVRHQDSSSDVDVLIAAAERASSCFCEVCGGLGSTQRTPHGWIKTLCHRCAISASADSIPSLEIR